VVLSEAPVDLAHKVGAGSLIGVHKPQSVIDPLTKWFDSRHEVVDKHRSKNS
jgi:hypothetical protein